MKQPDADWRYYRTFLLPDDERRQWISTRAGVQELTERGLELGSSEQIHHWLHFPAADKRSAAVAQAGAAGFEVHELSETDADDEHWFWVELKRTEAVELASLHKTVMSLVQQAQAQGGGYDGWEVAPEPA